jgi:hypothetical protein
MVVDEVGGGCTFFGGGLLTRGLSTCGVGELREPCNASFSKLQYLAAPSGVMTCAVVDVARGGCTLFGEGLLTHGLSTCGVGELREPFNASSIQASVRVDHWGITVSGTEGWVRVIGRVDGGAVVY